MSKAYQFPGRRFTQGVVHKQPVRVCLRLATLCRAWAWCVYGFSQKRNGWRTGKLLVVRRNRMASNGLPVAVLVRVFRKCTELAILTRSTNPRERLGA